MKVCSVCGKKKDFMEFHKDKASKDGYIAACKPCRNTRYEKFYEKNKDHILEVNSGWRKNHKDKMRLYIKKYNQTEKGKAKNIRCSAKHKLLNAEKVLSRAQARCSVLKGIIEKLPCFVCGSEKSQMHHEDYSKPLEVIWLCRKHHMDLHNERITLTSGRGESPRYGV